MFRRKTKTTVPEDTRRAFGVTAGMVDEAQRALIAAVPTSRHPGMPLAGALRAFLTALDAVEETMPAWRHETTHHEWTNCSEGVHESRTQAEALHRRNADLTFEQLNAVIGDVLYPLEVFADAERDLRRR